MNVDTFYVPALMKNKSGYISIVAFTPYSNYQLVKSVHVFVENVITTCELGHFLELHLYHRTTSEAKGVNSSK